MLDKYFPNKRLQLQQIFKENLKKKYNKKKEIKISMLFNFSRFELELQLKKKDELYKWLDL